MLQLRPVNPNVYAVHTATGAHVGNLKRIGEIWKFKAVGYGTQGEVEPGGGPLTGHHNAIFEVPDAAALSARVTVLPPHC